MRYTKKPLSIFCDLFCMNTTCNSFLQNISLRRGLIHFDLLWYFFYVHALHKYRNFQLFKILICRNKYKLIEISQATYKLKPTRVYFALRYNDKIVYHKVQSTLWNQTHSIPVKYVAILPATFGIISRSAEYFLLNKICCKRRCLQNVGHFCSGWKCPLYFSPLRADYFLATLKSLESRSNLL